jgi:hypothetical protein
MIILIGVLIFAILILLLSKVVDNVGNYSNYESSYEKEQMTYEEFKKRNKK